MTMLDVLLRWLFTLLIDASRYFVAAGLAFAIFWVWGRERFAARRVLGRSPDQGAMLHDLRWSVSTVVVFSLVGVMVYFSGLAGWLQRRDGGIAALGWPWFLGSIVLLVVLQDTYFYWTHRAMHHPRLYRAFHHVHHAGRTPSPWTAYAFAVPEALVHAAFVPAVWVFLPLHELAVFVFLLFMIGRNVLGHLSIELNAPGFTRHPFWGVFTTTTHHSLHHAHAGFDFGLYFTFWDRVMGTTHPRYHETFEDAAAGASTAHLGTEAIPD
jgi:Delta7-sterol 5-desaturase